MLVGQRVQAGATACVVGSSSTLSSRTPPTTRQLDDVALEAGKLDDRDLLRDHRPHVVVVPERGRTVRRGDDRLDGVGERGQGAVGEVLVDDQRPVASATNATPSPGRSGACADVSASHVRPRGPSEKPGMPSTGSPSDELARRALRLHAHELGQEIARAGH